MVSLIHFALNAHYCRMGAQETSSTNATLNDTKTNEIAPTTLSAPVEESQGSSEWASTTLDALGPVINTPYPVDKLTDTDASTESNVPDEVNVIQKNHFEEQTSDDTHIELITINKHGRRDGTSCELYLVCF